MSGHNCNRMKRLPRRALAPSLATLFLLCLTGGLAADMPGQPRADMPGQPRADMPGQPRADMPGQPLAESPTRQLSIGEALELAATSSDSVRARAGSVTAAQAASDAARAAFLPKISGSVSAAWLVNPPTGVSLSAGELGSLPPALGGALIPAEDITFIDDAKSTYFKGNITLTQPIFTWGKIGSAAALAALEAEIAQAGLDAALINAKRQVEASYFAALFCRESKKSLTEIRDLAASIVSDRKLALDQGLTTEERLLSAKADLADVEARLIEVDQAERTALRSLALLTGIDTGSVELVSGFRTKLPAFDEHELENQAVRTAEGSVTARKRLSEADRKVDLARGSRTLLPDLAFFTNVDVSGQTVPFSGSDWMKKTWAWDVTLGLSAKADLFDGGAASARLREAKAGSQAATAALSGQEGSARLAARQAMDTARRAEADLNRKTTRCEWAAAALKAASASYANQLISRGEFNGVSMRELFGRLELLQAQYGLEEAIADLETVNGGSFK